MDKKTFLTCLFLSLAIVVAFTFWGSPRDIREDVSVPTEIVETSLEDHSPRIALVLDDLGYSMKNMEEIKALEIPVTLAVLPNTPYSKRVCSFADQNGMEIILHMPMEPESQTSGLEVNTIMVNTPPEVIAGFLDKAIQTVPSAKGVSNHMGSKVTGDSRVMENLFPILKERKLFFFDSSTARKSVCELAAEKTMVSYSKRDIFIDHVPTEQGISDQMKKLEEIARSRGLVSAIGHDRSLTVKVLGDVVPGMVERGIRFVTVSDMLETKK